MASETSHVEGFGRVSRTAGTAFRYLLLAATLVGILALAAGSTPNMPAGELAIISLPLVGDVPAPLPQIYLEPILPMTGAMVQLLTGDITGGGIAYRSLFAIGLTLFVITLVMNAISDFVAQRYREEY